MIMRNVPQVDCFLEADRASRGPPGKLFAPLDAVEGSFYVFDPKFSLLHVRSLEEVIVLFVRGNLEHQLREELPASDFPAPPQTNSSSAAVRFSVAFA